MTFSASVKTLRKKFKRVKKKLFKRQRFNGFKRHFVKSPLTTFAKIGSHLWFVIGSKRRVNSTFCYLACEQALPSLPPPPERACSQATGSLTQFFV